MRKSKDLTDNRVQLILIFFFKMDLLLARQEHPSGHDDFIDLVVPILQYEGIFRTEYETGVMMP